MSSIYDVIVVGLGGMGSSALYHLSKNKLKVLGLEQFKPLHRNGSSHGETRVFRKAYFEGAGYIPLLERSEVLFRELEALSSKKIFNPCGLAFYGDAQKNNLLKTAFANAKKENIKIEVLEAKEADMRFSNLRSDTLTCLYEPEAGYINPEETIRSYLDLALKNGARIVDTEAVMSYSESNGQVEVKTNKNTYISKKIVFCAGPWTAQILKEHNIPIKLKKMILYWFQVDQSYSFQNENPCFGYELPTEFYYGFPSVDKKTVKIAAHLAGDFISKPEDKDLIVNEKYLRDIKDFVQKYLRGVSTNLVKTDSCIYSLTPDENFIIDRLPNSQNGIFACGFSGHGFKFVPAIGEILSQKVLENELSYDLSFLNMKRF